MYQAFYINILQLDKQAERGCACNNTRVGLTDPVQHEFTLEPVDSIARSIICAPFRCRTMLTEIVHSIHGIVKTLRFLSGQQMTNSPVHEQVRIAPNWRGKVSIVIVRQPEMADIVRRVFGTRHGTQQHCIDKVLIRPTLRHRQHSRVIACGRLVATAQPQPQLVQEFLQIRDLVCSRRGMHAIECRHLVALQIACCSNIGHYHAFFDHLVRIIAYQWHNFFYLAICAEHNAGFSGFKINGTAFAAPLSQCLVQAIQLFKMRHQRLAAFTCLRVAINHDRSSFVIGKPCVRTHQAIHET